LSPFESSKNVYAACSVLDPDSHESVDFGLLDPDPDPGGQKSSTKAEKVQKFNVLKCGMFSFEG
jgi:hypothetical protein